MNLNKRLAMIVILVGLLIGGLLSGIGLAGRAKSAVAAPAAQTSTTGDAQKESTTEGDDDEAGNVDESAAEDDDNDAGEAGEQKNEATEPDKADEVAPANTGITADEARIIAETAYPGTVTLAVEYDNENGVSIFEAELDNGTDVKVDATSGQILGTDVRDSD